MIMQVVFSMSSGIGWPEMAALAVVGTVVLLTSTSADSKSRLHEGLNQFVDELALGLNELLARLHDTMHTDPSHAAPSGDKRAAVTLWVAQGFGVGRAPFAPGTFGTLMGLLWLGLLSLTGNLWLFLAGTAAGLGASVWFCGAAEKILRQTDPGSVVLDEIAALPICFLPWIASVWIHTHALPAPEDYFQGPQLLGTVALFALFRVFDIVKPWPVRQSQRLPGGWGVTTDDVLAAVYVAAIAAVVSLVW